MGSEMCIRDRNNTLRQFAATCPELAQGLQSSFGVAGRVCGWEARPDLQELDDERRPESSASVETGDRASLPPAGRISGVGTGLGGSEAAGLPRPTDRPKSHSRRRAMLSWAVTFLIIALIAGVLGFTAAAGTAAWIAKVLFLVFIVLFIVSLISGRRATPL